MNDRLKFFPLKAIAMARNGGIGIIHRFLSVEEQVIHSLLSLLLILTRNNR